MEDFGRLLKISANQMGRRFDQFARQYELTGTQMAIIDYLNQHKDKEILQRDVEREFNIQRSTATVLLQRMEKRNFIRRKASVDDARQKSVQLTQHAKELEKIIASYMREQQEQLEAEFSTSELELLSRLLKNLVRFEN
ncbi:MarR family winged helix-turn-helix transcriptional regulator [Loigolactobacillus iwatensis]|nr:MarR family transcriptional regulator [Loigolactobacillus iwatensis]